MPDSNLPIHCYGKCCDVHNQCARYHQITLAQPKTTIATCTQDGNRPLFLKYLKVTDEPTKTLG